MCAGEGVDLVVGGVGGVFLNLTTTLVLATYGRGERPRTVADISSTDIMASLVVDHEDVHTCGSSTVDHSALGRVLGYNVRTPGNRGLRSCRVEIVSSPTLVSSVARTIMGSGPGVTRHGNFGGVFIGTPYIIYVTCSAACSVTRVSYNLLNRGVVLTT